MLWTKINKPILALSPMLGITDSPFRQICKECGADVVFTEMMVADAILNVKKGTPSFGRVWRQLCFKESERPIVIQITGSTPQKVAQAAKIICDKLKPDGIDINMGCPAKSAIKGKYGAMLLEHPDEAAKTVRAVKDVCPGVPVSVKIRSGLSDSSGVIGVAKLLVEAGADALSVHGRTKEQGYKGVCDWSVIGLVAKAVKVPVFGSGDMTSVENVVKFLGETRAVGALIARGAIGQLWIFKQIKNALTGKSQGMDLEFKLDLLLEHARLAWQFEAKRGLIKLRKHLKGYLNGLIDGKELRMQLMQVDNLEEFKQLVLTKHDNL